MRVVTDVGVVGHGYGGGGQPAVQVINDHLSRFLVGRSIARHGALDLWQPDLTWGGGITGTLRILALARRHGVPVVPHRGGEPWGLHLIVATDCLDLAETMPHRWQEPRDDCGWASRR